MCPPWCNTDPDWLPHCKENEFLNSTFDFVEFNTALNNTKVHSAPGIDGIDYDTLSKLPVKYKLILLDLYNQMYWTGEYPDQWKTSYLHFISKSDGQNVRPISLTSCVCKLFEKIIKTKLEWWVEYTNILPTSQSGFRKGRCTIDSLADLTLNVEESFSKNNDLVAAFLDISSAFDNVNISILLQKLADIGCPINLTKFIKHITYERTVVTSIVGETTSLITCKGVPQGGVLSPLLYNIYVSNIIDNIPKSITMLQFADDIALYCKRPSTKTSVRLLEKATNIIYENLYDIGLDLSPKKPVLVHFNRRNFAPGQTCINIKNTIIQSSDKVRFLGLTFDYKLTFD